MPSTISSEILKPQGMGKRVVIVGGGGYVGYYIGTDLYIKGYSITLYDVSEPDPEWLDDKIDVPHWKGDSDKFKFIKGCILKLEELENAFESADCVIHCASFGMSGKEQMPALWDKTELINVTGTKNVIQACCSQGVKSLVYTSSVNVVFGGEEIRNGKESELPYYPSHRHIDHYSRTKSIAEQFVLMADKKVVSASRKMTGTPLLRTCALRLAGVMGLKEKRHLPRVVSLLPFLKFRYGYTDGLVQFVTLPNVIQSHVKAVQELATRPDVVGGQAYFISDGKPINSFEFFRPLLEKLGYSYPKIVLPMWLIWIATYAVQFCFEVAVKISPQLAFNPILTPAEVCKTAVTHYFSNEKAQEHLGFIPENPYDMKAVAEYFYNKQISKKQDTAESHIHNIKIWILFGGMILLICLLVNFTHS